MKISQEHLLAIEKWMKASGYSQRDAARQLEVNQPTFHRWLKVGAGIREKHWLSLKKYINPYLSPSKNESLDTFRHRQILELIANSEDSENNLQFILNILESFCAT